MNASYFSYGGNNVIGYVLVLSCTSLDSAVLISISQLAVEPDMMKDITHYFHSPLSVNDRVASSETTQCYRPTTETVSGDKMCIQNVDEVQTAEVLSDESVAAVDVHKTPKKKKKRRKDSPFSKKGKKAPPEPASNDKSSVETNVLPSKQEAKVNIKVDKAEFATDKYKGTNAFLILMSPKTKPVVAESNIELEEVALTAVKENISVNNSGKLKLTTKSRKRKKPKEELEEENVDKNKNKKAKYDKTARRCNILGEFKTDSETNSERDERKGGTARRQNISYTDSEVKVADDSKDGETLPDTYEKTSGDSCNGVSADIDDKNVSPEKEVNNGSGKVKKSETESEENKRRKKNRLSLRTKSASVSPEKEVNNDSGKVKKNEAECKENKRRKKNKLSLRTKGASNLLRKHSSPENSLILSPETQTSVKTPNSLFKYFNRVGSSGSEKIEVKALVHSPPVSPSIKMRMKIRQHATTNKLGNGMLSPARRVAWKLRVKLRTQEEEDEISSAKDGEDNSSSDDHIFTPEKKRIVKKKVSVQQHVASIAVKKAVVVLTRLKSPRSPLSIHKAAVSPKKLISPNRQKAVVNLAPLFTRTKKVDAAVVEARKKFLKSGVPEQVKRILDIQRSMEEQEHYVFPIISHVQQKEDATVWNLPDVILPMKSHSVPLQLQEVLKLGEFSESTALLPTQQTPSQTVTHQSYKTLLEGIKAAFPEFPVYRTFRRLRARAAPASVPKAEDTKWKRRSKRAKKEEPCEEENVAAEPLGMHKMWTEKYKPLSGQEVVGNGYSVGRLRKWLEAWKHYSEEAQNRAATSTKQRKDDASSGDEFVDSDSGGSERNKLPDNTVILVGPYGTGKTCAVYAIANELGFKVLEINSSSRRNGKRILSELQEATQSHQVQAKGDHPGPNLNSLFKTATKNIDTSRKHKSMTNVIEGDDDATCSRMSLILVEGVEVVYEDHDEGFISALNTLVASSKRPVVLVTSDPHCAHISRFMDQHQVLKFRQPPVRSLSVWLQLVCLLEGLSVSRVEIERLLDLNSGDVRRTLLQLQYWVLSGGDKITDNSLYSLPPLDIEEEEEEDEQSNMSWDSAPEEVCLQENSGVVKTFVDGQLTIDGVPVSYPTDLDHIWWNIVPLLSLIEVSTDKAQGNDSADASSQDDLEGKPQLEENRDISTTPEEMVGKKCSQQEIDALANLMDAFSHADTLWCTRKSCDTQGIWRQPAKDGISLQQDLELCHWQAEKTSHNICNFLLEQGLTSCRNKLNSEQASNGIRLSRPSQQDFNWQVSLHANNKAVLPAISLWSHVQHRAVCSDYLPLLRTVIRHEKTRLATNTKRGNRFFHYLKGLNVHASEATYHSLSEVFATKH